MKNVKIFLLTCIAGMATLGMSSCSKSDTNPVLGDPGNYSMVNIQSTGFNPSTLTVGLGMKVLWTNTDNTAHTVTSDDGTSFSSGNILPQGTFTFTANQLGTFTYHCSIHPGETGTLYVATR